jgi:hypothetical protein
MIFGVPSIVTTSGGFFWFSFLFVNSWSNFNARIKYEVWHLICLLQCEK